MEQFTASEVRDYLFSIEERSSRQWLIAHDTELGMLRQFADLLEAREKAVPVAYADAATREEILNVAMRKGGYGCEVPLFVHPAPADAERLAEALRNLVSEWVAIADDGDATLEDSTIGYRACANRLSAVLAAHSAQAQPPADQFDPERNVRPGDVGTEVQTAEQDAADFGTGFEVDGRRVAPERVRIFRGEQADQLPSDAERLAEALERTARHRAAADGIDPDRWRSVLYGWEDRALTAHSAQAQPPAARVTDAMVEDGCMAWNKSAGLGYAVADRDCMRAAIEAALAAQENPNG